MEDKEYMRMLSILVVMLLGVTTALVVIVFRQKKTIERISGKDDSSSNQDQITPIAKTTVNRRPQLERVTVESTIEKRPIYKSNDDTNASEGFYYDDVKPIYQQPSLFQQDDREEISEKTGQAFNTPKLIGTRMFLLFAYIVAGATLFVSIFYLLASYMATRG